MTFSVMLITATVLTISVLISPADDSSNLVTSDEDDSTVKVEAAEACDEVIEFLVSRNYCCLVLQLGW